MKDLLGGRLQRQRELVVAIAFGAFLAVGGATLLALGQASPSPDTGAAFPAQGDTAILHARFFDAAGNLLLSSHADDFELLRQIQSNWTGDFIIPDLNINRTVQVDITDDLRPFPLGTASMLMNPMEFIGKDIGYKAFVPIAGQVEYEEKVTFERTRGPFNITMEVPLGEQASPAFEPRTVTIVEGAVTAVVEPYDNRSARVVVDVTDGATFVINRTGFQGTIEVDEANQQFFLHLDAVKGDEFGLESACNVGEYHLGSGSYRVAEVTPTTIELDWTAFKYPQFLYRDLIMVVELEGVKGEVPVILPSHEGAHHV